jgi:hypothetical protein
MNASVLSLGLAIYCFATPISRLLIENTLYVDLGEKGPVHVKALESLLERPDEHTALVLFTGAATALSDKRTEDSAFLFYAAQLRARFDGECFPPKGSGDSDPFVALSALSEGIGSAVNSAIMQDPKAYARAVDRLRKWVPKVPPGYSPGYSYKERKTAKVAAELTESNRKRFVKNMGDVAVLLNEPEYFAAFQIVRAHNVGSEDNAPTEEAAEAATKKMKRIERARGIKGIILAPLDPSNHNDMVKDFEKRIDAELAIAACRDDVKEIEQLLSKGANPNAEGKSGMTPLTCALEAESEAAFKYLLDHGGKPDYVVENNASRDTTVRFNSLIGIAASKSDDSQWLRILLKHNANPNVVYPKRGDDGTLDFSEGTTPLYDAIDSERMENVELLIHAGADVNHQESRCGGTPAIHAAEKIRLDMVLRLLQAGADHRIRCRGGDDIAYFVVLREWPENAGTEHGRQVKQIIALLEQKGVDMAPIRKRVAEERRKEKEEREKQDREYEKNQERMRKAQQRK